MASGGNVGNGPERDLRFSGRRACRWVGVEPDAEQDIPHDRGIGDHRDELALGATVGALKRVDLEDALQQLGPGEPSSALVLAFVGRGAKAGAMAAQRSGP